MDNKSNLLTLPKVMQTAQLINAVYPNFENSKDNPESYYLLRFLESYYLELNEEELLVVN